MKNIEREISRNIPTDVPSRFFAGGIPILTAYGCALLERNTGSGFFYSAVNLKSGRTVPLSRRTFPLSHAGVNAIVERIRLSDIADAGRLEADRRFGEQLTHGKCLKILSELFADILPQHGYAVRAEQVSLAEHILEAISSRHVTLAEAEVGTGKTLAYLVPAILAKRGRLNDFWNKGYYPGTPYAETANLPIVIATSSIALQKAIVTDYIPELSDIMMAHGIITTPLTSVIRKGREHYICERNLRTYIQYERDRNMRQLLQSLQKQRSNIDLSEVDGLTPYVKRRIAVPERCDANCPNRDNCAYLKFRTQAQSSTIDIQVVNHNYLLADTLRRAPLPTVRCCRTIKV